MNRIPNFYREPLGLPLRWCDDESGQLPRAVKAYYGHIVGGDAAPSAVQISLVAEYLAHYIDAPCWERNPHLDDEGAQSLRELREKVKALDDCSKISAWLDECLDMGLDPL